MGGPGPRSLAASGHSRRSAPPARRLRTAVASMARRQNSTITQHRRGRLREVLHRLRDVWRALPLPDRHAADEATVRCRVTTDGDGAPSRNDSRAGSTSSASTSPRRPRRASSARPGCTSPSSPLRSASSRGTAPSSAAGPSAGGPACRSTARSPTRTTTTYEAPPCITRPCEVYEQRSVGVFRLATRLLRHAPAADESATLPRRGVEVPPRGRRLLVLPVAPTVKCIRLHGTSVSDDKSLNYTGLRSQIKAPRRPSPAARGSGPRGGP